MATSQNSGNPNGATFRSHRVLPYRPQPVGPDGSNHPNESVFLELHGASRLVIQHVSQPRFVLTVTLAPHEAGTAITWAQEFEDSAAAARFRHIVEPANEQNLDRLLSVLARTVSASVPSGAG